MKSIEVVLFDRKLLLSQRYIKDIIDVSLFDKENKEAEDKLFINAFILHSALKRNLDQYESELNKYKLIRFYEFKKKREKRNIEREKAEVENCISVQNIMARMGFEELQAWCEKVYELDFGPANDKKKV